MEGREREGPKLLLNQGPSEPCYATAKRVTRVCQHQLSFLLIVATGLYFVFGRFAAARHSAAVELGDDVRVRAVGQLRGVRRSGQHLFHLQSQDARGQRQSQSRTVRTQRIPVMLPVS